MEDVGGKSRTEITTRSLNKTGLADHMVREAEKRPESTLC
jgi:hypothetical protein